MCRRLLPLLLLGIAAVAGAAPLPPQVAASPASGLYGTVRRGSTQPVCRAGVPCDAPAAFLTLVFLRQGRERARVTTSAAGRYRVRLVPGSYEVRATSGLRRVPQPPTARVRRGRITRADFFFDTGIR